MSKTQAPGRSVSMQTRIYDEPGRGRRVQTFLLISGQDPKDARAVAQASVGKLRKAEIVDSSEFPGCVEIHDLSANSNADIVLQQATLTIAGLAEGQPLPGSESQGQQGQSL